MVWNRVAESTSGRRNPPQGWVWSPAPTHPAIVSRELFERAAAVGRRRVGSRDGDGANLAHPDTRRSYLLRSMVVCVHCDRRMRGRTIHQRRYTYYTCRPAEAHGPRAQELWPDHCVRGTRGAALHPAVPDEALTLVLRKGTRRDVDSYSAFRENAGPDGRRPTTGLGAWLVARGIRRVFVCGLARDFCVRWSAEDAAAEGLETCLVDDLTRPVFPERQRETDEALARAGVRVIRSADLERTAA